MWDNRGMATSAVDRTALRLREVEQMRQDGAIDWAEAEARKAVALGEAANAGTGRVVRDIRALIAVPCVAGTFLIVMRVLGFLFG